MDEKERMEKLKRDAVLLEKFRPDNSKQSQKMTSEDREFEEKVKNRDKGKIAPGAKATYEEIAFVREIAKRSIAETNERRRKIIAVEKRKNDEKKLLFNAAIIGLALLLLAAAVRGPKPGYAFDQHDGHQVPIGQVNNPGR